jgi:hypothetical protein
MECFVGIDVAKARLEFEHYRAIDTPPKRPHAFVEADPSNVLHLEGMFSGSQHPIAGSVASVSILGDPSPFHSSLTLPDCFSPPPQVGESEAEQHMKIAVIERVFELGSDRDPGGVGVGTGLGLIASQRVRRREGQAPCGTVLASRCTCAHRSGSWNCSSSSRRRLLCPYKGADQRSNSGTGNSNDDYGPSHFVALARRVWIATEADQEYRRCRCPDEPSNEQASERVRAGRCLLRR